MLASNLSKECSNISHMIFARVLTNAHLVLAPGTWWATTLWQMAVPRKVTSQGSTDGFPRSRHGDRLDVSWRDDSGRNLSMTIDWRWWWWWWWRWWRWIEDDENDEDDEDDVGDEHEDGSCRCLESSSTCDGGDCRSSIWMYCSGSDKGCPCSRSHRIPIATICYHDICLLPSQQFFLNRTQACGMSPNVVSFNIEPWIHGRLM